MNRRRFLQLTVALAACAPIARLPSLMAPAVASEPTYVPPLPAAWIPTYEQVAEWLEYYKICVRQGCERFEDLINTAFAGESIEDSLENYRAAERAYAALATDRHAVAFSQGQGYQAGRDGLPRLNPLYSAASNEAFGWYNMWAVGDADRRGVKLPRSSGVTWPNGSPA